jgi:integrase
MNGAEGGRTLNLSIANRTNSPAEKLPKHQAMSSLRLTPRFARACKPSSVVARIRITPERKTLPRRYPVAAPAVEFGPVALANVRQSMIVAGQSRKLINKDVNRVRGMFGWAVEHELLPVDVRQALRRVKGPRMGRSDARETAPVEPVAEESIRAILPHLSPQVAAMIQLQHLCGARPQEVVTIRPDEVDTSGEIWLYHPRHHKMEHFDRRKVIMLGPKAQEVLRPWLDRDPGAYCFVPAETSAWHYRRSRRKSCSGTPTEPVEPKVLKLQPGLKYTRHSYRVAVQRACKRAGIEAWSPRQLRHTRATAIRKAFGLEAAKAVLGHTDTKITEIYAERDLDLARKVMREIG